MTRDPDPPPPVGSYRLLRDRSFGPFFAGNLVSNSGTWFQNIAAILLIHDLTGSATLVGMVSAMQFGFALLVSPWSGVWADRWDRRRLMLIGQTLGMTSAVTLAYLARSDVSAELILLCVAVAGVGHAITSPAMQASIPSLVGAQEVAQAVALQSLTFNLARAVGPALGAFVYVRHGPSVSFTINAASYLVLILVLLRIHFAARAAAGPRDRSVLAGLRLVRSRPDLLACLIGVGALGFAMDPVNTLTPKLAEGFGMSERFVGTMVTTFGIGAVCGVPLVGRVRRGREPGVVGRASLVVLGLSMAALAVSWHPAVALAALLVGGASFLIGVGDFTATLHARVDDGMRGRIMAIWGMAFLGVRPVAALLHGSIADTINTRVGVGFATVVALTAATVTAAQARARSR